MSYFGNRREAAHRRRTVSWKSAGVSARYLRVGPRIMRLAEPSGGWDPALESVTYVIRPDKIIIVSGGLLLSFHDGEFFRVGRQYELQDGERKFYLLVERHPEGNQLTVQEGPSLEESIEVERVVLASRDCRLDVDRPTRIEESGASLWSLRFHTGYQESSYLFLDSSDSFRAVGTTLEAFSARVVSGGLISQHSNCGETVEQLLRFGSGWATPEELSRTTTQHPSFCDYAPHRLRADLDGDGRDENIQVSVDGLTVSVDGQVATGTGYAGGLEWDNSSEFPLHDSCYGPSITVTDLDPRDPYREIRAACGYETQGTSSAYFRFDGSQLWFVGSVFNPEMIAPGVFRSHSDFCGRSVTEEHELVDGRFVRTKHEFGGDYAGDRCPMN